MTEVIFNGVIQPTKACAAMLLYEVLCICIDMDSMLSVYVQPMSE